MTHIKSTVRIGTLTLELLDGLLAAAHVYSNLGYTLVVTSWDASVHGKDSLHYQGRSADLRFWTIPEKERPGVLKQLKLVLGPSWDVIQETDHFHIEYDPKVMNA